jgi:hypothetical protein
LIFQRLIYFRFPSTDSPKGLLNGSEETTPETRAQAIALQQRYTSEDLYKPRYLYLNQSRRRRHVVEENSEEAKDTKVEEISS